MKEDKSLQGKAYWRSLEELAESEEFKTFLHREFPENASELTNPLTRRKFLSLMSASIAFAGLAGCRKPVEKIVPYVNAPENVIPGVPKHYATTMPLGLSAYGLLVESHEGRPTKIEGNKMHPSTLGKSNALIQASILGLYDPDRSKTVLHEGVEKNWSDFVEYWRERFFQFAENGGEGLTILSESFASPTLYRLQQAFKERFPNARWYVYEPVSDENIYKGINIASGAYYHPRYYYDRANVILSLESDFLLTESENVNANKTFSDGRRVHSVKDSMSRLYAVENTFSLTGGMADHRLRLQSREIPGFLVALIEALKDNGLNINLDYMPSVNERPSFDPDWLNELVNDLMKHRGRSIVTAGRRQPPAVHAIVYLLNQALGNVGKTIEFIPVEDAALPSHNDLRDLVESINNDPVQTLFMLGGNPVYNAPADLDFEAALKKIDTSIHLSTHVDETSQKVNWHLPLSHYLESWGDTRAMEGSLAVTQPLIRPLFKSKSYAEVFELLATGEDKRAYNIVRETWQNILGASSFERQWEKVLHDGVLAESALPATHPAVNYAALKKHIEQNPLPKGKAGEGDMEVVFQPSPAVFDGRFANNGWLQEMPDPVTKLVWDNAVLLSPATAKAKGLRTGELVGIQYRDKTLKMPVMILPGQADHSVVVNLGYGRTAAGRVGNDVGFNAYRLRSVNQPWFDRGATLQKTGETYKLANTQDHWSMEGRPLVREASLDHFRENPKFASEMVEHPPLKSLWEEHSYEEGYQWGMTIDLNACTGCNACVVACQSENNIPIVGKEQVAEGREMHWIRLDRYFSGDMEDPEMVYQPVACQHCENAPCEQVCPVQATLHDDEGLNVMTYNRCIGTRYCSNNCPYKVRRFNFFNYTKGMDEVLQMAQNPDVTVRSRGVMEKCTFCIQRINRAKIKAQNENRRVEDGEIVTACQQACPTDAIVFGNINDRDSRVSQMKQLQRNYTMLAELNVQTRNTFLAKLRNPNPALESNKSKTDNH